MRFEEFRDGVLPISNEENRLINKIKEHKRLSPKDMNQREQEVARKLVSRGPLRKKRGYFLVNEQDNI